MLFFVFTLIESLILGRSSLFSKIALATGWTSDQGMTGVNEKGELGGDCWLLFQLCDFGQVV